MSRLKAIGEFVVIEPVEVKKSEYIITPDTAKDAPMTGRIISIGDEVTHIPVRIGSECVFSKFAGSVFTLDGKEYIILRASELLAEVTPE